MKDDELRAFLESATVGGEDEKNQAQAPAESTIVLPSAPADQASTDRGLSFDDLIGQGPEDAGDARPIVLPGPPEGSSGRSRSVAASAGLAATVPIVTPPIPNTPSRDESPQASELVDTEPFFPPTQPISAASLGAASQSDAPELALPTTSEPNAASPISAAAVASQAPTSVAAAPIPAASPTSDPHAAAPTQVMAHEAPFFAAAQQSGSMPPADFDSDYEKISVTGGASSRRHLVPWIIVAGGAVVALLIAFFVVSSLSGGSASNEAGTTTQAPGGSESTPPGGSETTGTTTPPPTSASPSPSPTPTTPPNKVPTVEVGPTMNMPIAQWGVQVDLSQKLGDTFYQITGENLVLTSSLTSSMPAICSGEWGMTRSADGSFAVLKPQGGCAEAPELYDELWGLMDAMVKTARPL